MSNNLQNMPFFKHAIAEATKNKFFCSDDKPLPRSYVELLGQHKIYNAFGLFRKQQNFVEQYHFSTD